jgi:ribosomal-protein-alanine N-acetyltransferase
MKLTAAGTEHAAVLAVIHANAFPPGAAWDAATLETLLALDGAFALRAGAKGFILARQTLDEAEILTLAVNPAARRRGIGAALVRTALAAVGAAGAKEMFLEVAEANEAAIDLYVAAGFKKVGLRRDYYAPGAHALVMRRSLIT